MQFLFVVLEQISEDLSCGNELRWREFLIADHQDVVIGKSAVERTARLRVPTGLAKSRPRTSAPLSLVKGVIV
jgi:hypothetical protein